MSAATDVDITSIKDEDLLRKMWQTTDDFARKKEIRTHMYKLRESRLRDFYSNENNESTVNIAKDSLNLCHGDSIIDHSFQSLKAKEIRDCESPSRDRKFDINVPDTSGWDIHTSVNLSKDGKTQVSRSEAKTDGIEDIRGGHKAYSGRNEQISSITRDGDENNSMLSTADRSQTVLNERTQTGDENSGRTETKSTSITSSSEKTQSHHVYRDPEGIKNHSEFKNEFDDILQSANDEIKQNQRTSSSVSTKEYRTESTSQSPLRVHKPLDSELEREFIDVKNAELISRDVSYPDENTRVLTETKCLPDGTVVTTRKYESKSGSTQSWSTSSNQKDSNSSRLITEERAEKRSVQTAINRTKEIEKEHEKVSEKSIKHLKNTERISKDVDEKFVTDKHSENLIDSFSSNVHSTKKDTHSVKKDLSQRYGIDNELNESHKNNVDIEIKNRRHVDEEYVTDEQRKDFKSRHSTDEPRRDVKPRQSNEEPIRDIRPRHTTEEPRNDTKPRYSTDEPRHEATPRYSSEKTFTTESTTKKISTEVDAAHTAFAKSLRSMSPTERHRAPSMSKLRHDRSPSRDTVSTNYTSRTITKSNKETSDYDSSTNLRSTPRRSVSPTKPVHSSTEFIEKESKVSTTDSSKKRPVLLRSETFEERCKQILGMGESPTDANRRPSKDEPTSRKSSLKNHDQYTSTKKDSIDIHDSQKRESVTKTILKTSNTDVSVKTKSRTPSPVKNRRPDNIKDDVTNSYSGESSPNRFSSRTPSRTPSPEKMSHKTNIQRKTSDAHKRSSVYSVDETTQEFIETESKSSNQYKTNELVDKKPVTRIDSNIPKTKVSNVELHNKCTSERSINSTRSPDKIKSDAGQESDTPSSKRGTKPGSDRDGRRVLKRNKIKDRTATSPLHVLPKRKDMVQKRATTELIVTINQNEENSRPVLTTVTKTSPKLDEPRRPSKCITTKTINLSSKDLASGTAVTRDTITVIENTNQSKSSREPSPDKLVPVPMSSNEDISEFRYPDKVIEPDDHRPRAKPTVKNIPIFEEGTNEYVNCHITEINDTKTTRKNSRKTVDEDECLLSVTDKVSKFTSEIQKQTKNKTSTVNRNTRNENLRQNKVTTHNEIPKVPSISSTDNDEFYQDEVVDDECQLSVNDKVNKFILSAQEASHTKPSAPFKKHEEPSNTNASNSDVCLLSVSDKVSKFKDRIMEESNTVKKQYTRQQSADLVNRIDRELRKGSVEKTKPEHLAEPSDRDYDSPSKEDSKSTVKMAKALFERQSTLKTTTRDRNPQPGYEKQQPRKLPTADSMKPTTKTHGEPAYMKHTMSSTQHKRDSTDGSIFAATEKHRTEHRLSQSTKSSDVVQTSYTGDEDIESIFDLVYLEQLLENVSDYDQRRRIRAQIRLIKKNSTGNTTKTTVTTVSSNTGPSATKITKKTVVETTNDCCDCDCTPMPTERRPSEKLSHMQSTISSERRVSDKSNQLQSDVSRMQTNKTQSTLRTFETKSKVENDDNDKPIWAKQNILRKADPHTRTVTKTKVTKTTTTSAPKTMKTEKTERNDSITSSYGIGPTDDDGNPIFGLRALRRKTSEQDKKESMDFQSTETMEFSERKASTSSPSSIRKRLTEKHSDKDLKDRITKSSINSSRSSQFDSYGNQKNSEYRTSSSTSVSHGKSFLNTKNERVTGVNDIIDRMRNADYDNVAGDSEEDRQARSLLNKFLGASVLMTSMEAANLCGESDKTGNKSNQKYSTNTRTQRSVKSISARSPSFVNVQLDTIWDLDTLKLLLEKSTKLEEQRKIKRRIQEVMAEKEDNIKCELNESSDETKDVDEEINGDVNQTTEVKEQSTVKRVDESDGVKISTTTSRVVSKTSTASKKPVSAFAKFQQLDKQNAAKSQSNASKTDTTTVSSPSGGFMGMGPHFKFTDPALNRRAATVKEQLLQWCQIKTREYENVKITNFSSSWSDGMAFCALIHHFLPDAFDFSKLTPKERKHNFELAFTVADEKAGIAPLLDVEDMVMMKTPDWKCVFTYVQSIFRRFRNQE